MKTRLLGLALLGFTSLVFAQTQQQPPQGQGGPGGQPPMGPPKEAFEACKGKKDGDAVSLTTPQGKMAGTCRMVWMPRDMPQGGPGGQPGQGQGQGGQRPPAPQ